MTDNIDFEFKIILLGEVGVGKECIINRYCKDTFTSIPTYGIQFDIKYIDIINQDNDDSNNYNNNNNNNNNNISNIFKNSYRVKLVIFRQKPVERFPIVSHILYKNADAIILVYDTTNKSTFNKLPNWITTIKNEYTSTSTSIPPITIVGNKCDALPQIINADPQQYNDPSLSIQSFQHKISAKESINLDELFQTVVYSIINNQKHQSDTVTVTVTETTNINNNNNWCNIV